MADVPLRLPGRPEICAELAVGEGDDALRVSMSPIGRFDGKLLGELAGAHRDPISTDLTPALLDGAGTVIWLVGYRMSAREHPGDVLVTYALLLECGPNGYGPVRAVWFEDHEEVPRTFCVGGGRIEPNTEGGAAWLELELADEDYGDGLRIEGLIRGI